MVDNINHPKHYEGNIECIDAMQEALGKEGVIYLGLDLSETNDNTSVRWYVDKAIALMETNDTN